MSARARRKTAAAKRPDPTKATAKRLGVMAKQEQLRRRIASDQYETARFLAALGDGYEIAKPTRTRRRYRGTGGAADRHLTARTLWQLREICRKHDRDSSLMGGLLNRAADEIVGPAFSFRPTSGDEGYDRAADEWIAEQMTPAACTLRADMDYWMQLRTTLRAVWTDGDILKLFTAGGRMQYFEADELATPREKPEKAEIVNGVETARGGGAAIAYHVKRRSAATFTRGWVSSLAETNRLPAADCILPAYRKRFNQTRGVPFLAVCLGIYDRLDGYLDSETLAAQMNAMWGAKITRDIGEGDLAGTETRTDPGETADSVSTFDKLLRMESGTVFDLAVGEDVEMLSATRPGITFEPFIITVCRIVGVGVGLPLELLLLDFSRTNYSSARASLGVARRAFKGWQKWLELHDCRPWYRRAIARGIAAGALDPRPFGDRPEKMYSVRCIWPAWPHVDLAKQMAAHLIAVGLRVKSRGEIIREEGGDPEEVFSEIEAEEKRFGSPGAAGLAGAAEGPDGDERDESENREQGR